MSLSKVSHELSRMVLGVLGIELFFEDVSRFAVSKTWYQAVTKVLLSSLDFFQMPLWKDSWVIKAGRALSTLCITICRVNNDLRQIPQLRLRSRGSFYRIAMLPAQCGPGTTMRVMLRPARQFSFTIDWFCQDGYVIVAPQIDPRADRWSCGGHHFQCTLAGAPFIALGHR